MVDYTLDEIRERAEIDIVKATRKKYCDEWRLNGEPSRVVDGMIASQSA